MASNHQIAQELDRVMRKIDAQMHRRMPAIDEGRIGPMGGFLLMQLETLQPCPIQALATAMGRDNSQLTRLVRDLEKKGVLQRRPSPTDGRATLLSLTDQGTQFLTKAKNELGSVLDEVVEPLSARERQSFLGLLMKI